MFGTYYGLRYSPQNLLTNKQTNKQTKNNSYNNRRRRRAAVERRGIQGQ